MVTPLAIRMGRRPLSARRTIGVTSTTGYTITNTDPAYAVSKAMTLAQLNHVSAGVPWVQNAVQSGATAAQLATLYQWYSMVPEVAAAVGEAPSAVPGAAGGATTPATSSSSGGWWANASTTEKIAIVGGGALVVVLVAASMGKKRGRR